MNNDEIRALVDETKATIASFNPPLGPHALVYRLADAIEALLARQDAARKVAHPYVLTIDYAALEAERDEWKRRCERLVLALSEHGYTPEAVAHIAEGRDNG